MRQAHGWRNHKPARTDRAVLARERRNWLPAVEAGRVTCWRCGLLIERGQRWHVGHTDDGARIVGPEHEGCNLRAASAEAHRRRWGRDPEARPRTTW